MTATVYGVTEPRVHTPALRELTPETSLGFNAIRFAEGVLGMTLYPWQRWLLIHALELREDGSLRYTEIHITIARQNGKTAIVRILLLWRMFMHARSGLVLGAAQNRTEAMKTWNAVRQTAIDTPTLKARLGRGSLRSGAEAMCTSKGASYEVVTLKPDAGRGRTAATVFMDEMREHRDWAAWSALSSTTLVPEDSLIIAASNAGDAKSVVMRAKRDGAMRAITTGDWRETGIGWFEWSAPDGCELDDIEGWRQANPSLGYGLSLRSLKAERDKPDAAFRTENLCQWVDTLEPGIFPWESWQAGYDRRSKREGDERVAVGLDVSWDRAYTSISIAFDRADGRRHVEVIAYRAGTEWAPRFLRDRLTIDELRARGLGLPGPQTGRDWFDGRVSLQQNGCPAADLIVPLQAAGIDVVPVQGAGLSAAVGSFYSRVHRVEDPERPIIVHRGQPVLDEAIRGAMPRTIGDAWLIDRRGSSSEVSPAVSCSHADWLLDQPVAAARRSAYDDGATYTTA